MFVRLWVYQKSLWIKSNWFEQTIRIRCWSKSNLTTEFVRKLKNLNGKNTDGAESMFNLTMLEKIKEARPTFSQGSVTVL